jgi:hypothetical protein
MRQPNNYCHYKDAVKVTHKTALKQRISISVIFPSPIIQQNESVDTRCPSRERMRGPKANTHLMCVYENKTDSSEMSTDLCDVEMKP